MRIVLKRTLTHDSQSAEDFMRIVFAHITHHIVIRNVSTQADSSQNCELIQIDYDTQPDTANVNFRAEIEKAVSLQGSLGLVSLEIPPRCIQVPGLRAIGTNDNGSTIYKVESVFAKYLVNYPDRRQQISAQRVIEVKFEFEQIGNSSNYRHTGRVATTTAPISVQGLSNAYSKFAACLGNDPLLQNKIQSNTVASLQFTVNQDGSSSMTLQESTVQQQFQNSLAM